MAEKKKDEKAKKGFTFGPFEQALLVLIVLGFASHPSLPYLPFGVNADGSITSLPFLSPPFMMLVIIAYIGYHILTRQEAARDRAKALSKVKSSSSSSKSSSSSGSSPSSSSSQKPLSSSDIRAGGMPSSSSSSKRVGNPAPKQVSGKDDPSSTSFRKNYFLTMQGPGRPALVPFQDGLRPKKGDPAGTLWWDNVPDDAADMMAPPIDKEKLKATMKNPWAGEMIEKDIQLLKIAKRQKEEEERYSKVANLLQTILGFLLCAVDMRLGVCEYARSRGQLMIEVAIVFFLWRHFTKLHDESLSDEKDAIEKEKKEIMEKLREARKAGMNSQEYAGLQMALDRLG
uniref:Uncharacterized protein n=1 Tax=Kwoniella dejecticola CBS 10117 TaxID=1296121 RepID=A0A1A5ZZE3_9TREE|nr:uncharacterized protein I303_06743 [Kwoniella dejecticola CBS 10117]OBR83184.1 hypothetical protein I303_06743 [Kwoniella dejecticola CBS 10117]